MAYVGQFPLAREIGGEDNSYLLAPTLLIEDIRHQPGVLADKHKQNLDQPVVHHSWLVWGLEIVLHGSAERFIVPKVQHADVVAVLDMVDVVGLAQALKMRGLERYDEGAVTTAVRIWFVA